MMRISKHFFGTLIKNILLGLVIYGFAISGSSNLSLHYIGSVLLIFYWLFFSKSFKLNNLLIIYSCFTIYAFFSGILVSINKETFFIHAFLLIQLCFISILVFNIFKAEKNLINFSVIWVLIGVVLTIGPFIGIGEDLSLRFFGLRYMGLTENPNVLGMYINYSLISILYLLLKLKKQKIIMFFLVSILILLVLAIFSTGSRKAIISFVLILLTYIIYQYKFKLKNIIYATLVILTLWLSFDNLTELTQDSSLINRLSSDELETGIDGRTNLIKSGFNVFLDYPLTGAGLANWSYNSNLLDFKYSHNYYIEVLANTGIIGFILIIAIYRKLTIYVLNLLKNYSTRSEGIYGLMYLIFTFVWSFGFSWYDAPHHFISISVFLAFYYSTLKNINSQANKILNDK